MPINEAFRVALQRARRRYESLHGDIKQAVIGEKVAALLPNIERSEFSPQLVSRWFQGWEPKFSVGLALAVALDADPFELASIARREGGGAVEQNEEAKPGAEKPNAQASEYRGDVNATLNAPSVAPQADDLSARGAKRGRRRA